MKIKEKLKKYFRLNSKVGLIAFLAAGFFIYLAFLLAIPIAEAATNCRPSSLSSVSSSITICDGLSITITNSSGAAVTQAAIGDTIKINVSITDQGLQQEYAGKPKNLLVGVCNTTDDLPDCATGSTQIAAPLMGTANSISFTYTVGGPLAKSPGATTNYKIGAAVDTGQTVGASGSAQIYIVSPIVSLSVSPSSNTGPSSLKVQQVGQGVRGSGGVLDQFNVTFLPGASGLSVKALSVDCNYPNGQNPSLQPIAGSTANFNCTYPTTAKTYQAVVYATLSDNSKIQSAALPVTITGDEATQEAQVGTANTGGALLNFVNEIVGIILGLVQEIIYAIFFWLIAPLIQAMLSIHTYTDTFVAVIYPGWIIVRNVCNIFFIVALIIIAMATLFRVESYQFRHLLVQLILAALLVNFSLVIGQAILGLADTIQAQFLPANVTVIRSLAGNLMVQNYRDLFINNFSITNNGTFATTVQAFFWVALSLGTFAVFCAIAVFLVVRIIALWILLLISPIAYAAGALPATAKYRSEWWQNFLKYAFFTPIMAFFLNITAVMANTFKTNPVLQSVNDATLQSNLGGSGIADFVFKAGSNILLLVFLVAALKVAEAAGIYGASTVTGIAQKGMFAPFALAGRGAQAGFGVAGRKWNEFTANKIKGDSRKVSLGRAVAFAALNPVAFGKAWAKERDRKTHDLQEKAEMAGLEVVQQRFDSPKTFFKGGYKIEPHVLQHEKHHEDEKAKNLQNMSRENVAQTAAEYFMLGNDEDSRAYKRGVIKLAMSKGYIDDIVQEAHKTDEGRKLTDKMIEMGGLAEGRDYKKIKRMVDDGHGNKVEAKDANGNAIYDNAMEYNNSTRRNLYKAMFGWDGHHLKDHAAMRLITEEGESEGMNTGHLEYMTDMYFDNATGDYKFYDLKEQKIPLGDGTVITTMSSAGEAKMAGAEIAKKDSRTQARIAWHSLMSSDGKQFYKDVFSKVSKSISENPTFMQERTANMLVAGTTREEDLKDAQGNVVERGLESIREDFAKTGNLKLTKEHEDRLEAIRQTDQRAFVSIISRFMNDASPDAVATRTVEGFQINGRDVDLKAAKKLIEDREDAKDKAKEDLKARTEARKKQKGGA